MRRDRLQELLDDFNGGNDEALTLLMDELAARFAAVMATVLHRNFHRLSEGEQAIGTATVAQEVRLRIAKGIHPGALNDADHLMRIAARNARWFLLDEVRKRKRAAKRASDPRPAGSAVKFWLTVQEFVDRLPKQRLREFYDAVQTCTEALPSHLKEVFERRFFAMNREVAAELGLTPTRARGRWDMANAALKKCLLEKFPPPDINSSR